MAYGRNKLKTVGVVIGLLLLALGMVFVLLNLPFLFMALHGD
jgi:hypothetical protein